MNNKAKVRRLTKSLVLGKAKVISYKDLKVAQAKRLAKDSTLAAKGKGKRGRKSKNSLPEQEDNTAEIEKRGRKRKSVEPKVLEPTSKMVRAGIPKPATVLVPQASRTLTDVDEIVPVPWSALVAPM